MGEGDEKRRKETYSLNGSLSCKSFSDNHKATNLNPDDAMWVWLRVERSKSGWRSLLCQLHRHLPIIRISQLMDAEDAG
ncbi:GDSL esterase/lipase [Clarias magur]|uniref:GDSL esterase/lipase n=1 Tax=Clarias magur TaxID=1594786 RepID=A0A8J4TZ62_CLAMG|nr:GDSL esterase/lipase [Clarias magur]